MGASDFRTDVDLACQAAEKFVSLYYETIDKRRGQLTKLYMETATMVWNGNLISGQEDLAKIFDMLPSSEFQVHMFDCQPVHEQATPGQKTVLVVAHGLVKFKGNKPHYFIQNFLITEFHSKSTNNVWKIASDCFRFQDSAS